MRRVVDPFEIPKLGERKWRGRLLHPIDEAHMFFRHEGPVPETLERLRATLESAAIPHIFIGATAVYAHGYERTTRAVDLCMRAKDLERFRNELVGTVYQNVAERPRRFFDPATGITFDILVSGAIAGDSRRQPTIRFPDPGEAELVSNTPLPTLARLIELKLVTRRPKDWADVIELIRANKLDETFVNQLHATLRSAYLQCHDQKQDEDRYNPEVYDAPPETTA